MHYRYSLFFDKLHSDVCLSLTAQSLALTYLFIMYDGKEIRFQAFDEFIYDVQIIRKSN